MNYQTFKANIPREWNFCQRSLNRSTLKAKFWLLARHPSGKWPSWGSNPSRLEPPQCCGWRWGSWKCLGRKGRPFLHPTPLMKSNLPLAKTSERGLLSFSQLPFYGKKRVIGSDANRKGLVSREVWLLSSNDNREDKQCRHLQEFGAKCNPDSSTASTQPISCKFAPFHGEVKLSYQPKVSAWTTFVHLDLRWEIRAVCSFTSTLLG